MSLYKRIITKLLKTQNNPQHFDSQLLTFYIPTKDRFKNEELKRIKGFLLTGLKKYHVPDREDKLHKKIVTTIEGQLKEQHDLREGIAIFGEINKEGFTVAEVIVLSRKPERELFIGNSYDLDQLIFISNLVSDAVVLSLSREKADVFTLTDNKLFKLQTLQNEFALKKERPYLNRFSPTSTDISMHGVGSKSLENRELKENQEHLREVGEYLASSVMCAKEFPYLVIYYSEQYSDVLTDWVEKYRTKFCDPEIIVLNKTFRTQKSLEEHTLKLISKLKKLARKKALRLAKEDYPRIVTSWSDVYNAAKLGNVESLFIKSEIDEKYRQISMDVLANVSKTNGKVIIMRESETTQPVLAKLRFVI